MVDGRVFVIYVDYCTVTRNEGYKEHNQNNGKRR